MTESLQNVLSVLGMAATCLRGALTLLTLAFAYRIIKDSEK